MFTPIAPLFDDLVQLRFRSKKDGRLGCLCSFEHGRVWFNANRLRRKANIEVAWSGTGNLAPSFLSELIPEFARYMDLHPEISKGGNPGHFGATSIRFHVRIEDADMWLRCVFDIVRDESNFVPYQTPEQVVKQTLDEIRSVCGAQEPPRTIEGHSSKLVVTGQVERIGTSRIGQSSFSEAVRSNYQHHCCFPGCTVDHESLLVGAHIARWSDEEGIRGDVSNGLCLCVLHDKAFESGLFVLSDEFIVQVVIDSIGNSTWGKAALWPSNGMQIVLGKSKPSVDSVRAHRKRHDL